MMMMAVLMIIMLISMTKIVITVKIMIKTITGREIAISLVYHSC